MGKQTITYFLKRTQGQPDKDRSRERIRIVICPLLQWSLDCYYDFIWKTGDRFAFLTLCPFMDTNLVRTGSLCD